MSLEEIIRRFFSELDPGDGRTLCEILSAGAGKLIAELPDRSEFPSERSLSEHLKVHRNTVRRALEPYISSGKLKRNKRRTLVCHAETVPVQSDGLLEAHPLQLQALAANFAPPCTAELRFVHYETMPEQQRFWNETREAFELSHPSVRIRYIIPDTHDPVSYRKFIQTEKPDLYQMLCPVVQSLDEERNMLLPLPDDLFSAKSFRTNFFESDARLFPHVLPLYHTLWVNLLNADLMEKYEIPAEEFIHGGPLIRFAGAASKLPRELKLSSHYSGLTFSAGHPRKFTPESMRSFAKDFFDIVEGLLPRGEDALFFRINDPFFWFPKELVEAFVAGQVVHIPVPLPFVAQSITARCRFKTRVFLLSGKKEEMSLPVGIFALGIPSAASHSAASLDFCRHLYSEEEQRRLVRLTGVAPVRKSAVDELSSFFPENPDIGGILNSYSFISRKILNTFWSGRFSHNPFAERILDGRIGTREAVSAANKLFADSFPQYMEKDNQ